MPIEMPRGLPFSVDTWTAAACRKRHHFITHAHKDHLAGISAAAGRLSSPIYSTRTTAALSRLYFPNLGESLFVLIEVGNTLKIDDADGAFSVSAFHANHCPGAVMFLFEGIFGNVLHTGDCRLTPECLQHLPSKYLAKKSKDSGHRIDYLFLDCTFGRCSLKLPSKHAAIQQVINCIWKHPNAQVIYLACDLLGQEEILIEVSRTFGSRIYIDKEINSECLKNLSLLAPDVVSLDASSRFQVIEGFPRLHERASQKLAESRANNQPEPLFIRPSAQWYANDQEMSQKQVRALSRAERDELGIWHVCYSMHSSREELEWALQLIQPNWVISTTPPCRAMELDYVKKHCFKTHINQDDPLWKLLKLNPGEIPASVALTTAEKKEKECFSARRNGDRCHDLDSLSLVDGELNGVLPPLSRTRPLTLFGRARLGVVSTIFDEITSTSKMEANKESEEVLNEVVVEEHVSIELSEHDHSSCQESSGVEQPSSSRANPKHVMSAAETSILSETRNEKMPDESNGKRHGDRFHESLRRFYRSRNVAVPEPLPSLVKLLGDAKRIKLPSRSRT